MTDWMVRAATMSVFGRSDRDEGTTAFERLTGAPAFDMPAEMAAAMRLMANPATGMMAMSALGFGIAAQTFGLWAGTMTGAAQLSQRMLTASAPGRAAAAGSEPQPQPKREKPALTVVAANEASCRVSTSPKMKPVSCCGKNPFGMIRYRYPVTTMSKSVVSNVGN